MHVLRDPDPIVLATNNRTHTHTTHKAPCARAPSDWSKIEEIRFKSAFSLEGKIPIFGPDKPVK